ncbi:MAG: hypothetical protein QM784_29085 [Polyangiaceae bacterium]
MNSTLRAMKPASLGFVFVLGANLVGCMDDTGSGLVEFQTVAGGPKDATSGEPYEFETAAGYHIKLERARLTIGALYLNRAKPILGAQDTSCVLPGLYAAEATSGVVIDALSPKLVAFDQPGRGTADRAYSGEVWLTGGDIDALEDRTRILDFAGTATREGREFGFHGVITIGQNRALGSSDPATPGANPICKQRIVTPIAVDITPASNGRLVLRVIPKQWFSRVDFAALPGADTDPTDLEIPDTREDPVSNTLFHGLLSVDAYTFDFED